jgi:DNA-binding GntR family transcriptional regulator
LREHHKILAALRQRDTEGARLAMAAHIRSSGEDLQVQVGAD